MIIKVQILTMISGATINSCNTKQAPFGDNGISNFVRTNWDDELGVNSSIIKTGKQVFEEITGGLYVAEPSRSVFEFVMRSVSMVENTRRALNEGLEIIELVFEIVQVSE